jgi:transcription elongation factor Elf1
MPDELADALGMDPDREEIENLYNRRLTCPYCGHVETDSWEIAAGGEDGDIGQTNCGECNREYEYTINVDITYSSNKIKD